MPRDQALEARYGLGGHPVIMTLGRLSRSERYKGVDEVMDVLLSLREKIPNLKYLIVGDGDDRARLEAKAGSLGLTQHVVFANQASETEKVAHYSLGDVFVMPSSGEGFGIVLLEAAACGLPVIGSAIDGSREALLGGALGQLVDPRNSDELEKAILGSLTANQKKLRPPGLETYFVAAFQTKLNDWLEAQTMKRLAA
jgi:glycosyltransferase involved in cell wall biosynthesis